uniref:Uncharacterized protein n=1 Tax=Siphoviridae sp. ct2vX3 TaxID=2825318 RepID=A0A8S5PXF2_9CAUD|nr:MAG TPA: hypothetical protein [Siphoviridae sp. ct2vX3]
MGSASSSDKICPTISLYTFLIRGLARDWVISFPR